MRRYLWILVIIGTVLSACGSAPTAAPTSAPAPTTAPAPTAMPTDMAMAPTVAPTAVPAPTSIGRRTTYPVTISDCGSRTTTYEKTPERVVTLDPAVTEMLLLLGLKDKIVGFTEFQTPDQRWAPTKADMDSLKVINKDNNYPSKEAIVATSPDLVMSIYPSALLSNKELPDRDGWAALGIKSYLTQGECHLSKTPVTDLSLLYADLRNFGVIFDVQERAEAEIAKLQARVAALQQKAKDAGIKPLSVWSYSGEDDPYPAGAVGTPNAIITMAGAKNAFGDVQRDYDAISWEEIVKRNPDVIWVMTSAGPGFIDELAGIKKKLAEDPRLQNITAVKNKAYVVVSYNEGGVETPRNVDALEQMINGLIALAPTAGSAGAHTQYPLTITGCGGHIATFKEAPKTTVTMDPQAFELMFWLGLGETQIAAGPQPLPAVPDQFKDAAAKVTAIARGDAAYPSKEALLAAKPDFVYGSYQSGFSGDTVFSEDDWASRGVNTYWSLGIGGCTNDDPKAPRSSLDPVFKDIENLGKIFDVQDRANALIAQMKTDLAAAVASVDTSNPLRVTVFGIGDYTDGKPGINGSSSTVNAIITMAGGKNAFADVHEAYLETSWEEFVKRDPQVILLIAYPAAAPKAWDDAEKLLTEMPALQNVAAVKNKHFVRVTFPEVGAGGVRNVDAVKKLAEALAKLK